MTPLISVRGLRYSYDESGEVLHGINFDLMPRETVALLGRNGSGKTTFVLHLNGLLRGQGAVTVCGMNVDADHVRAIRRKVGLVFQDSDDQLFMPTVLEDVAFGPLQNGASPADAAQAAALALDKTGMAHAANRAPYHLSAGEKKRVAIAGILAMDPEILVLDEPTTFLDPPAQRELLELLQGLPQAKLIVTHDLEFAEAIATRAVCFAEGRIVDEGTPADVVARSGWRRRAIP